MSKPIGELKIPVDFTEHVGGVTMQVHWDGFRVGEIRAGGISVAQLPQVIQILKRAFAEVQRIGEREVTDERNDH